MNHENKPFVSAPLTYEPAVMAVSPIQSDDQAESFESEYPDIYHDVFPLVSEAADQLTAGGYVMTHDMLNSLVDTIIKNSGMWYEDDEDNIPDALPVVQFGFNRAPYQRRRRRHHNRNTLRDVVRILLLRELFDRRNGRYY